MVVLPLCVLRRGVLYAYTNCFVVLHFARLHLTGLDCTSLYVCISQSVGRTEPVFRFSVRGVCFQRAASYSDFTGSLSSFRVFPTGLAYHFRYFLDDSELPTSGSARGGVKQ